MEENKFDLLDEVEQDMAVKPEGKEELKEYQKLLLAERDRKDYEKAKSLVKIGCFNQVQETTVDYNDYESIPLGKKYKGLYLLFRKKGTNQLVFICPLVEDNKGDSEAERKDLAPYAYDVIYTDQMDEETYQMVLKAAKNNYKNFIGVLYTTSVVLYFVLIAVWLFELIFNFVNYVANGAFMAFGMSLFYAATFLVGIVIATPLLALLSIKYKKYKAN